MLLTPAAHDAPDRRIAFLVGAAVLAAVWPAALAVLADASTAEGAFWGTVIAGAGGAIIWLSKQAWDVWKEKQLNRKNMRAERKEDESAIVTGYKELVARLEAERQTFVRELDEMQGELRHMTAIISSAKERIVHLEEFVIASNPKYRPWIEPPAPSARYAPAPPIIQAKAAGDKTP